MDKSVSLLICLPICISFKFLLFTFLGVIFFFFSEYQYTLLSLGASRINARFFWGFLGFFVLFFFRKKQSHQTVKEIKDFYINISEECVSSLSSLAATEWTHKAKLSVSMWINTAGLFSLKLDANSFLMCHPPIARQTLTKGKGILHLASSFAERLSKTGGFNIILSHLIEGLCSSWDHKFH